ncbi:MAG TPA: hypothetical protein DDY13_07585 [Cytophagales bacterium]|jgi:hypothetical protein|nr:hypothetical protein [Cytophagales bacterium]
MKESTKRSVWEENYSYLENFLEENGRFPTVKENSRIHNWLRYQRYRFKKGELSPKKSKKLKEIGFLLSKNNNDVLWERRYELLKEYIRKGFDPNVPRKPDNKGVEYILSNWLNKQRYNFRKGILPLDKAKKLEEAGVYFSWKQYHFEKKYQQLKSFYKKHGHFEVPYTGKHKKLRQWIDQIRSKRKEQLTPEQLQALNELGLPFKSLTKRVKEAREKQSEAELKMQFSKLKKKDNKDRK